MLHIAYRYGDTKLFARFVCLLRGGDSAHVEMCEPLAYGLWRCTSSSHMDGGPRTKDMPLPAGKWRVYATTIHPAIAREWLANNKGKSYGWWKLIRFAIPLIRPSFGGPICTQACAQMTALGHADSWDLRTLEAAHAWRYERVQ